MRTINHCLPEFERKSEMKERDREKKKLNVQMVLSKWLARSMKTICMITGHTSVCCGRSVWIKCGLWCVYVTHLWIQCMNKCCVGSGNLVVTTAVHSEESSSQCVATIHVAVADCWLLPEHWALVPYHLVMHPEVRTTKKSTYRT